MRKLILGLVLLFATAVSAMAQTVPLGPRFVLPYQTVVDGTGAPIPGAQLWFYSSGTTTPLTTYSDPLLTTPNSNPVQANAAGVFPNIFLSGNYKIVLTDSSNNQIWTADPVYGVGTGSGGQCQSITVNNQTGTFYTLQPSDNCKLVTFNNSSAIAVNLPSPATNASYQKWNATVSAIGVGTITVTTTGASFTGTGSGANLTVSAVTGVIATGFLVTGTGVPSGTTIVSQTSGTPGGAGVYVTSQNTTSSGASLTAAASIGGSATLAVLPGQAAQIISDGANYQVILSSPAGSSISIGNTVVLGGSPGNFLTVTAGPLLGQVGPTGTGQVVLQTSPSIVSPTITGSLVATGLVTNADLVNSQVTINGTACTLGGACSPTAAATSIAVGTTTISGGSGSGHVLSDNSGVVGELSTTITVNGTPCALGSTCAPSSAATSITIGTTTIVSGSANALLAQSPSGATVAAISTANNDILATNGSGVAAFANTLPTAVQGNITSTGTLTGGATGAGFTIALTTSTVTGINVVTNGGTGLATQTSGAIYKGNGTGVEQVSALSDNGTIVSSTESLDLAGKSTISEIANAASTGTTVNKLAKLTGAPSTALITATTDTNGAVGVVVGGAGTTGNAQVAVSGQATCAFDGGTTAGDYVQISASVAGDCADAGATYPSAHQVIGRVLATIGSAGNAAIVVFPPEIDANTGGGGSGVTSVTITAGTGMSVSGSCSSTTSIICTLNTPWSISGTDIKNNNTGNVNLVTVGGNVNIGSTSSASYLSISSNLFSTAPSGAGQGIIGIGAGGGFQLTGFGSNCDVTLENRALVSALCVLPNSSSMIAYGNLAIGGGNPWVDVRSGANTCINDTVTCTTLGLTVGQKCPVAIGNGSTNDRAAIQCQINYMGTTFTGGVVQVGCGDFLVNGGGLTVEDGVFLVGGSRECADIQVTDDETAVTFHSTNRGQDSQGLRDLNVDCVQSSADTTDCVTIGNLTIGPGGNFTRVRISGGYCGLYMSAVTDWSFWDIYVAGWGPGGGTFGSGGCNLFSVNGGSNFYRSKFDQNATTISYSIVETMTSAASGNAGDVFIDSDSVSNCTNSQSNVCVYVNSSSGSILFHPRFIAGTEIDGIYNGTATIISISDSQLDGPAIIGSPATISGSNAPSSVVISGGGHTSCHGVINITCTANYN